MGKAEPTPELRKKAAEVARKLAQDVEKGRKFGTHSLTTMKRKFVVFGKYQAPHCVLGHLAEEIGHPGKYPHDLGLCGIASQTSVYSNNDWLFGNGIGNKALLAQHLRHLADEIEAPIKNLPNFQ